MIVKEEHTLSADYITGNSVMESAGYNLTPGESGRQGQLAVAAIWLLNLNYHSFGPTGVSAQG
jgi:hypothetical protein